MQFSPKARLHSTRHILCEDQAGEYCTTAFVDVGVLIHARFGRLIKCSSVQVNVCYDVHSRYSTIRVACGTGFSREREGAERQFLRSVRVEGRRARGSSVHTAQSSKQEHSAESQSRMPSKSYSVRTVRMLPAPASAIAVAYAPAPTTEVTAPGPTPCARGCICTLHVHIAIQVRL